LSACWLTWPRRARAGAECFRLCRELLDGILLVRSGLLVEVAHVSACRNAYHLEYITQGAAVQVCTSLQVVHAHACNANFHVEVAGSAVSLDLPALPALSLRALPGTHSQRSFKTYA